VYYVRTPENTSSAGPSRETAAERNTKNIL
jgi:hypothetical protein